ncbi:M6 metalloprotease [Pleomassaria siparia CBS 279.74]|uniref:M6 metalloprotease n=1 Tax=Pleomassaria siparia CBS 279.74 TaxID=1314801 RepID=A0A6G1K6T2_9PLEO|nr:M6 metalloprotease [Pleomassaria siparia CBS 279.74]
MANKSRPTVAATVLTTLLLANVAFSVPAPDPVPILHHRRAEPSDPFAILDKQDWVNPDDMTAADFVAPPGTNWADATRKGTSRNFNIAMITIDYPDSPFAITLPALSNLFGNPQPLASGIKREDVPKFYHDLLNVPSDLNNNHTLHEYWMGDSFGEYGVDLTVFGPYRMPMDSWKYGVSDDGFNTGACPTPPCSFDVRGDAFTAWRADIGKDAAATYELSFILSAGQDESSTWQEFGEMKFASKEDVPDAFGPPVNDTLPNYAKTRYVEWTSWAAASTIWPTAGGGSSTQGESSGMAVFAHELSHLLGIGDNYNNPFSNPARRAYTGPFSMLDRGCFNGPGGPHTRWQIPPVQGASMGSLHTMRDKVQIRLIDKTPILQVSRTGLATSGLVVAKITARSVSPVGGLMGLNVTLDSGGDLSPVCDIETDPLCDGQGYDNYNIEVVDRMGADSFTPDSGVMISKTKNSDSKLPFQWVIDANPQDIRVIDFYLPNGTARYLTIGDYRQLLDALFHAGTRSGSEFEYIDVANKLHMYVIDIDRDATGSLHYVVGVKSTVGNGGPNKHGVALGEGTVFSSSGYNATGSAVTCTFTLSNTGTIVNSTSSHPQDLSKYLNSDIYRLTAEVEGSGWTVVLPNELAAAKFGEKVSVNVAVGSSSNATAEATVKLTATSESDATAVASASCTVQG